MARELAMSPSSAGEQPPRVIIPENKRLENWTSPALIIDGDENEEIEIYRAADLGDPTKAVIYQTDRPSIQKDRIRTIIN
jgi:hypothetical protein